MYLFYTQTEPGKARVDAIYQDHEVPENLKAKGYKHDGVLPSPVEGSEDNVVLYLDPESGALWYEGEVIAELSEVADLRRRLHDAETRLMNADERYETMDKQSASLAEVRNAKVEQLKYFSDRETASGFLSPSLGYKFGLEDVDQSNFTKQALMFVANPAAESCTWKTLDAGIVTMTKEQFFVVMAEAETSIRGNIARQWQLSEAALSAQNKDEVDKVVW